jgi:hypothetical protein
VVATEGTIVGYLYTTYRTASDEELSSRVVREKALDRLVELFRTNGTLDPSNAPRSNSNRVHHPDKCESLAALRTRGDKLVVHCEVFLPDFSAQYNHLVEQTARSGARKILSPNTRSGHTAFPTTPDAFAKVYGKCKRSVNWRLRSAGGSVKYHLSMMVIAVMDVLKPNLATRVAAN